MSTQQSQGRERPLDYYYYAKHVIKGRWPEGEPYIATDPYWAYSYANYVLNRRWPEGEPAIARDPRLAKLYTNAFPEAKLEWAINGLIDWTDL